MPITGHAVLWRPGPYGMQRPEAHAYIDAPWPLHVSSRMRRILLKASRDAMRDTLLHFWRYRWREEHFKQNSRQKYQHMERHPVYKSYKRRKTGSITDHVLKGASKTVMTQQRPIVTAKQMGASDIVHGEATMAPWPWKTKEGGTGITPADMAVELARWTEKDVDVAAERFRDTFVELLSAELDKHGRFKKRYSSYVASL